MGLFESTRTIFKSVPDLAVVAADVAAHFERNGYEVQVIPRMGGCVEISLTKGGVFRTVSGLRTALNIDLEPQGDSIFVAAGVGIFGQQAIPTAITFLVFWPVVVTQIAGLITQSQLDDEAMRVIEESVYSHAGGAELARSDGPAPEGRFCTQCGERLPERANFCPKCGTKAG